MKKLILFAMALIALFPSRMLAQCSGSPTGYVAISSTPFCDFCTLTLTVVGPPAPTGLLYQWQWATSTAPTATWSDLPGATTAAYTFLPPVPTMPSGSCYYRCRITCSASGLSANTSTVYVPNHFYMSAGPTHLLGDTSCNVARMVYYTETVTNLALKTDFGDGTTDSSQVLPSFSGPSVGAPAVDHDYAPGNYHVKHWLYYNNMLQDSFGRDEEFHDCITMPVMLYTEADGNCVRDAAEPYNGVPLDVVVDSAGITIDTITVLSGLFYRPLGPAGTVYAFRVIPDGRVVTCPSGGVIYDTVPATSALLPRKHFALACVAGYAPDIAVHMVVPVTGRLDQWGHIYVRNNYCAPEDATVKLKYSFKYNSHFTTHTPGTIVFPTATWSLPGLSASSGEKDLFFCNWASLSSLLTAGDTVTEQVAVTTSSGTEVNLLNNHVNRVDTVKASVDPNMIEVMPAGCFDTNTNFRFTVHFENTGNDTAHNVYVLDTLSPYLDASTLRPVMSSARVMNIMPYSVGGHNIVKFDFPKIKLLDSSWHGLNDGAFIYDIRTKGTIPAGSVIRSRVGIYFDYNDVVMTNTAENLKGCPVVPVGVSDMAGTAPALYPNPVLSELMVTTPAAAYEGFVITNAIGQRLMTQSVTGTVTKINVAALPAGIYYITFRGAQGSSTERFAKQ